MGLHACNGIVNDLHEMEDDDHPSSQTVQKEEMPSRITSDARDRKYLRNKLEVCIDRSRPSAAPRGIGYCCYKGKVVDDLSVNVDNAVSLGKMQLETFQKSWPSGLPWNNS